MKRAFLMVAAVLALGLAGCSNGSDSAGGATISLKDYPGTSLVSLYLSAGSWNTTFKWLDDVSSYTYLADNKVSSWKMEIVPIRISDNEVALQFRMKESGTAFKGTVSLNSFSRMLVGDTSFAIPKGDSGFETVDNPVSIDVGTPIYIEAVEY
jgi:hypothetical protein